MQYSKMSHKNMVCVYEFFLREMKTLEKYGYDQEDGQWNIDEYHTLNHFDSYIKNNEIYIEVVEFGIQCIAYIEARINPKKSDEMHIWWVLTDPEYKRQGIAENLYGRLEDFAKNHGIARFTASAICTNLPSVQLHKKLGYIVDYVTEREVYLYKDLS